MIKKFLSEFKAFAMRGNVLDLAVGVIIGGAFTTIVTSLTDNFINPILKFVTRSVPYYTWQDVLGFASNFLSAVVNFIIMAFILFCIVKAINVIINIGKKEEEVKEPTTKTCPYCKSEIDISAVRCAHCTSVLEE